MKKIIIFLITIPCATLLFSQNTVQLSAGTFAKATGGISVVFSDMNLVNNGTLQQAAGDGSVKFTGINDEHVSGSGITQLDTLTLAKASVANLDLQTDINIASQVNFVSGQFNIGNNVVTLATPAFLNNERENSRCYSFGSGYLQSSQVLNAPASVNVGNLGEIITSSANLGNTLIKRGFTSNANITGNKSILRYFEITPATNTGLDATLRFQYFDAELNGLNPATLDVWKSGDTINWTDIGFNIRDSINHYVEKTGMNSFSFSTLAPHFSVLPLTLNNFSASKKGSDVEVTWQVSAAINVSSYSIERSIDGSVFTAIGQMPATSAVNYSYLDLHPVAGNNFYRLRMTDIDGAIKYSGVVKVNLNGSDSYVNFYPNPVVNSTVTLQLTNVIKGTYRLQLFTEAGQQVYNAVITHSGGSASQTINLPKRLASGIYRVRIKSSTTSFSSSLLIQ